MADRILTEEQLQAAERLKSIYEEKKKELGLTQDILSDKCGWGGQGAAGGYISGHTALNLEAVLKLAAHLQCNPIEIYPEIIPDYMKHYIIGGFSGRDMPSREAAMLYEGYDKLHLRQQEALRMAYMTYVNQDADTANQNE